jgi:hypothetical protein
MLSLSCINLGLHNTCGGAGTVCPSAYTDFSGGFVVVTFCETPVLPRDPETHPEVNGVTITVDGAPITVLSGDVAGGNSAIFQVTPPIANGGVVVFNFDYSASTWTAPTEDIVDLAVTNLVPA